MKKIRKYPSYQDKTMECEGETRDVNITNFQIPTGLLFESGLSFVFFFPSLLLDYISYHTTIMNSRSLQGNANVQVTAIDNKYGSKDGTHIFF